MLALAHAARGRPKGARLKGGNDLFRVAGSFDKNHVYSTRLEGFHGARADAAAQYGFTIPQRFDKSGVTVMSGGGVARAVSVTTCIGPALDEFHLAVPGFEDEELAAAPEMGGKVDSIVRWYCDLHVQVSLANTGSIAAFGLYMQIASMGGLVGAGKFPVKARFGLPGACQRRLCRLRGSLPKATERSRGFAFRHVASLLSSRAHKARHRTGHVIENRDPLREVLFAAGREAIDSFRRPFAGDIPLGNDAVVLLQLP
jgi:hypothetical protein